MAVTVVHLQIRMPPHLHERLACWAQRDKASLNSEGWCQISLFVTAPPVGATTIRRPQLR
jgi:hypothetical protein